MSTTLELDLVVIGGGVVGLAVARACAVAGREVTLLEAETQLGSHSSSRNSEVIHAGIYYPTGSLKARLCVSGRTALYDYCEASGVHHEQVGKIIVATRDEEVTTLERLKAQAEANGVLDLTWLDRAQIHELEPEVSAVRGLLSPSTGIIDSHEYMAALRRDAEARGATVVSASPVHSGRVLARGIELEIGGSEAATLHCRSVVNAAGLRAQEVARSIQGLPPSSIPAQHFAKGHYFVLAGRAPFKRLVYPVPVPGGLGIHLTLDLAKQARFGPDVSWVESVDYTFDERRAQMFYTAIRQYYPALAEDSLLPGYTGIRPKLGPASAPAQDFVVQGASIHGVPGLVNLYGIESPGLTASLALAECVLGELI
ncbi:MAG TPA: NAD(P)/FAD-dependent oxidoreductase [Polyangiaceae bacterium]|jgi:L-2-hydroxyglutarate oxidase LhgO|nr:NAD(P)/FAD-dependent oxidoreductase [Polyangiaceae bacterium]